MYLGVRVPHNLFLGGSVKDRSHHTEFAHIISSSLPTHRQPRMAHLQIPIPRIGHTSHRCLRSLQRATPRLRAVCASQDAVPAGDQFTAPTVLIGPVPGPCARTARARRAGVFRHHHAYQTWFMIQTTDCTTWFGSKMHVTTPPS